jgi:hypothetical protein
VTADDGAHREPLHCQGGKLGNHHSNSWIALCSIIGYNAAPIMKDPKHPSRFSFGWQEANFLIHAGFYEAAIRAIL